MKLVASVNKADRLCAFLSPLTLKAIRQAKGVESAACCGRCKAPIGQFRRFAGNLPPWRPADRYDMTLANRV